MNMRLAATGVVLLVIGTRASAHRLDEYLQATTFSVEKNRIQAEIRLTPGVAVFRKVMAGIDTNGDGAISAAEQQAYAERVLQDLSLSVDGSRLQLRVISWKYPPVQEMKEGRGEIQIEFDAPVPGGSYNRKLLFENHHQSKIGAYLVNCLVPSDPDIQVTGQNRNYLQSHYELDYTQAGAAPAQPAAARRPGAPIWMGATVVLLLLAPLGVLLRRRAGTAVHREQATAGGQPSTEGRRV